MLTLECTYFNVALGIIQPSEADVNAPWCRAAAAENDNWTTTMPRWLTTKSSACWLCPDWPALP